MSLEVFGESGYRRGVLSFGSKQYSGHIEIHEDADVIVTPATRCFIDPNVLHGTIIPCGHGLIHVVMNHPPQPRIVLPDKPCHCPHRHVRHHGQQECFEEQREPAAGSSPRDVHRSLAATAAIDARNPGAEDRLELEEVQMAPAPLLRVVRLAASLSTFRTEKRTASLEIDADLELPLDGVEFIAGHVPRLGQTESEGEEVFAVHTRKNNRARPATDQFDRCIAALPVEVDRGQAGWVAEGLTPVHFHPNTFMRRSNGHSDPSSYPPEAARSHPSLAPLLFCS